MALPPSTRLGPYEIVAAIGAGGMGEVYRARDARLGRDVAIKVLPELLANDPDRRARFEREAKAVAALSHPNIINIFDTGLHEGHLFVVMELLDGETLRDRLTHGGALPVRKAVEIAVQIARGLAAAHDTQIVHRDLKPENIFLLRDGQVKILDFGLARPRVASPASGATQTMAATDPGIAMGTVGYMAPEQIRAQAVDGRADLFAFGAVLFEMLSGTRAFQRDTAADTMTAILKEDAPDLVGNHAQIPPSLDRIVRHCLEKNAAERFQSARDVAFALDALSGSSVSASGAQVVAAAPAAAATQTLRLAWSVAAAALLVAAGAVWWALRAPAPDVWTGVRLGGPAQAFGVRLSPDGQLLAFLAFVDHKPQVAVMKPDGGSWTVLTHEREGYVATVSWAPDSSRIYFDHVWGHPLGVYSVPPLGGEPRPLLDDAFGPEPLPDGSLIVLKLTDRGDYQLFHFWPDSGRLEPLPLFMPQADIAPLLRAFPDGQEIVFLGTNDAGRSRTPQLLIYNLASRATRALSSGVHSGFTATGDYWSPLDVSPDGQSVYLLSDAGDTRLLMEVPRRGGRPRALLTFPQIAMPVSVDAARDGSLYLDQRLSSSAFVRAPLSGGAPEEFPEPSGYSGLLSSPGGDVLMTSAIAGRRQLVAGHLGGELTTPVNTTEETTVPATIVGGNLAFTLGAGDARRLALASLKDGRIVRRYSARSDGGLSASPDGHTLYYSSSGAIWAQAVAGGDPTRVTDGEDVVLDPAGQRLYVRRARQGANEIVRMSLRGDDTEVLPVPPDYHVAVTPLSPAAVDGRGRILIAVASKASFYYQTAVLDPATKSFTLVPIAFEGDVSSAGWTTDGRVLAVGSRYPFSLWRYKRVARVD